VSSSEGQTQYYLYQFPALSSLRHTLQHIVDFGIRPHCLPVSDDGPEGSLMPHQLLHPSNLQQVITYPTQFCCTGMGYRSLISTELAQAFGFPIAARLGGLEISDMYSFVPARGYKVCQEDPDLWY
jgi:hypothetical protein